MAALFINLRCLALVTALAVVILIVATVLDSSEIAAAAYFLAIAWGVHLAALIVVGYPLGVLTSRLLAAQPSRLAATTTFAVVGGVSATLLTAPLGVGAPLIWFAHGAVTAGAARAWAHRTLQSENPPPTNGPPQPVPNVEVVLSCRDRQFRWTTSTQIDDLGNRFGAWRGKRVNSPLMSDSGTENSGA
ncbi:hypothetical protein [Pengzhenrongella frigida]|uniref:Uncharacterized protein n=1 Tax=Pengzhenrongella frigida TaxID=1259133 RepID=A0A4Q5N1K8_9MICO|nr:hypothetical protein [Cellulomonas sp. HLT2-17]RYV51926.1 hypothetical protein EUA98_05875 [Cellulomonas sp. HLT2-17]